MKFTKIFFLVSLITLNVNLTFPQEQDLASRKDWKTLWKYAISWEVNHKTVKDSAWNEFLKGGIESYKFLASKIGTKRTIDRHTLWQLFL